MFRTLSLIRGFGLIPLFTSGDPVALLEWCRVVWEGGCRIVELDGTQIKQDCIGKLRGKLPNMAFGVRGITVHPTGYRVWRCLISFPGDRDAALVRCTKAQEVWCFWNVRPIGSRCCRAAWAGML
jgi:hypothetical protein